MEHYGIRGKELGLFRSFLSDRTQFIEIDTFRSTILKSLANSCIQGSILANTLYTIYINEVPLLHHIMKCPLTMASLLTPSPLNNFLERIDIESQTTFPELLNASLKQLIKLEKNWGLRESGQLGDMGFTEHKLNLIIKSRK